MKKIFIFLCMAYAAESNTMSILMKKTLACVVATAPVTVPGCYYWQQTKKEQAAIRNNPTYNRHIRERLNAADTFQQYMDGVTIGMWPMMNLLVIEVAIGEKNPFGVGFCSGLSMYPAIPALVSYLRKIR